MGVSDEPFDPKLKQWTARAARLAAEVALAAICRAGAVRENAQSWRELLIDIKQRGLEIAPDLAVGDGALGFWKAIEQVFPSTRHQRCWVHKTANVLNKVALSVQVNMKVDLREIYGAPTRAAAEAAIDVFADKYSIASVPTTFVGTPFLELTETTRSGVRASR